MHFETAFKSIVNPTEQLHVFYRCLAAFAKRNDVIKLQLEPRLTSFTVSVNMLALILGSR